MVELPALSPRLILPDVPNWDSTPASGMEPSTGSYCRPSAPSPTNQVDSGVTRNDFNDIYAARADAFYRKALQQGSMLRERMSVSKEESPTETPPPSLFTRGKLLRSATKKVMAEQETPSMWDHFFSKWSTMMSKRTDGGNTDAANIQMWGNMQANFRAYTRQAMEKLHGKAPTPSPRTTPRRRRAAMEARHNKRRVDKRIV